MSLGLTYLRKRDPLIFLYLQPNFWVIGYKDPLKFSTSCSNAISVNIYPYFVLIFLDIIESVDSINRDERGFPLTQYITNGGISSDRNTSTYFKHHHRVLRLISNRMRV